MTRWAPYILAGGVCAPWLYFAFSGAHPHFVVTAILSGLAILGAAFLLSWACEVAEEDVPRALAVSVLALLAVLPEYAVDATFAWKAAEDPVQAHYAIANMTGGNRLLIGVGWALVGVLAYARHKRRTIELTQDVGVEVAILFLATLYAFVPTARGSLTLFDTAVLVGLYLVYLVAAARGEDAHELEQVGPAKVLAELGDGARRASVIALFAFAGVAIFVAAEPFAESLVQTGARFEIDEFLLVQWVAPLASESPEIVVAVLMVLRGNTSTGLRTLVSSKVNQWTLLVGTLAVVYSVSLGEPGALVFDERQQVELFLTAAQSLFAVAVLADLSLSLWQGIALFALFTGQLVLPETHLAFSFGYVALFVGVVLFDRHSRQGFAKSFRTLFRMLAGRGAAGH